MLDTKFTVRSSFGRWRIMVRGTGRSRITVVTSHFVALQPAVNLLALSTEDRPGSWERETDPTARGDARRLSV